MPADAPPEPARLSVRIDPGPAGREPDDAALVARARAGDHEAFGRLVARYHDGAWRFAERMLGDRADAQDAVQDAFLRALAALDRYDERQQFRGWLFRILANHCRNVRTARRRRWTRFVADDAALATAAAPGATEPAPAGADDHDLAAALAALDVRSREAVLLRFGEGMGYAEMSALTGAGESALKMRVQRACARLRALLAPGGPPAPGQ